MGEQLELLFFLVFTVKLHGEHGHEVGHSLILEKLTELQHWIPVLAQASF